MTQSNETILVIDDEMPLLIGVQALLERAGYQTIIANDSFSGVRMARENHPNIILCDVMLPIMDGFEIRAALEEDPIACHIPFLFLTARVSKADKLKGFSAGADDYITKPFDPQELLARVSSVLKRHQKGQESVRREMDEQIARFQHEISANISHELRTPITQILMALDMVLRDKYKNPDELQEFVEIALSQSYRLNSLIDDLIFLSNYDRGALNTLRQRVSIENDFIGPINTRKEVYADKALSVQIGVSSDVIIHAPRREFRQAVVHLVDNAFKFTYPKTGVQIDLEPNGIGGFILTVTDNGKGIPPQYTEEVFKRYFQISQGDTRAHGGLGVGLTIARIIARSLGGDIAILSQDRGCRMRMTIASEALDLN